VTRTTIDIAAPVLAELKERQRRDGRSLGELASELLARALADDARAEPSLRWTSRPMGHGIDLEDKDAVWTALDGHAPEGR
jgi:hypothetical protein